MTAIIAKIQDFIRLESSSGILLMMAAVLALIANNSLLAGAYDSFLSIPVSIQAGALLIDKPLLLWINDGLMAVFFFLVGLEIKREVMQGELSSREKAMLPLFAAFGGMAAPALIYVLINAGDPAALRGWAIPAATDIAFALGVLSLLGSRVPHALKVFLTSVAIIDDLGAILIIAVFYASSLSATALGAAALLTVALVGLNALGVARLVPYLLLGIGLWAAMLFSGMHATLAGVILAMTIPLGAAEAEDASHSPLRRLEDGLGSWVAFVVLPVFGFANAGVSLAGASVDKLLAPLSLGIIAGLFLGKQIGIMAAVFAATRTGLARLPEGASWRAIYGVAILCGIGFTMSLFIGLLAFSDPEREVATKIAVLTGSLLSALAGVAVLVGLRRPRDAH